MTRKVAPSHYVVNNYYIALAQLHLKNNDNEAALSVLFEREKEISRTDNFHRTDGLLFSKIGECYLAIEDYPEAENYLLKGFQILEEKGLSYTNDIEKALHPLIELYKRMENTNEVAKYEKILSSFKS
jgi:tetratricopeptide (TPR) repeat protein